MAKLSLKDRIVKAHAALMRHPDFCLFSGIIMMGKTELKRAADMPVPTACTDGLNTVYCEEFMAGLNDAQVRAVILHENLHKAFHHLSMYGYLFDKHAKDPNSCPNPNIAADFFVNQIIYDMDPAHNYTAPPQDNHNGSGCIWLQDNKYKGWSFMQIYKDIQQQQQSGGGGSGGRGFDGHDPGTARAMSKEEIQELRGKVEQALREGKAVAGMQKGNIDRQILDMLEPKVDWRAVLRDFVQSVAQGKDKSDWRRLNQRFVYQGIYFPSLVSERVGEIVVAIDTSGSIGAAEIAEFAGELASICEAVRPEKVRVLWWDTAVHGEQVFEEHCYDRMRTMLKPKGGGGTDGNCVPQYLATQNYQYECVLMFTDGYLGPVTGFTKPSLWFITQNKSYVPTEGEAVEFWLDE